MQNESPRKKESGLGVVRQSDTMAGLRPSKLQTNLSWQRQCPAEEPTDQRRRLLGPQRVSSASSVPLQRVQPDSAAQWILSRVLVLMGPGGTLGCTHETSPHRSALARLIVVAANSKILAAVRPSRLLPP